MFYGEDNCNDCLDNRCLQQIGLDKQYDSRHSSFFKIVSYLDKFLALSVKTKQHSDNYSKRITRYYEGPLHFGDLPSC